LLQSFANSVERPPDVADIARAEIDWEGNDIKSNLTENANGTRHVVGRCDEEPAIVGLWLNEVAREHGVLIGIPGEVLDEDTLWRYPGVDEILSYRRADPLSAKQGSAATCKDNLCIGQRPRNAEALWQLGPVHVLGLLALR
jgi:hypothetical protein